ncbi:DMT family transporter [Roseococcus sp. SYP-B2431]|uniref:DMT family transporter n=1 Tax=Roseococcus sp. SYP-B2431 TaxID=2496640 RepID=UPI00103A4316|nr:DMT family transporter [Roseococcus sp. SYP-B2431]TCH97895.1 DMT family transporter [Roseococcus sp. SYP-B2431]
MRLAYAQLALSMILVGANVGVGKLLAATLPIALILFLRCVMAIIVLWPLALWLEGPARLPRQVLGNLALQALFGTALYNAALLAGLRLTSALEGGMVLATLPAVVAIGSFCWLRERLSGRQWIAAALAGFGMAAITLARVEGGGHGSALGNLLILLGVCGEAVYVLLAKRIAATMPVMTASLWMQIFSALVLLPFATPDFGAAAALADPALLSLLLFHALSASVIALMLWYYGLRRVPAGTAGVFTAFLPASAAVTAVLFLGESFGAIHVAGFALMMTSVILATWPRR